MKFSLEGKVALVTGGSRGIGAATVQMFRDAGARVVFSYRSAADRAEALVVKCGGEDVCRALQQELASVEHGEALVRAAEAIFGRLDILVVNHGVWPPHEQPVADMSTAQWRDTLGINLDSVFGVVRAGTRTMLKQQETAAAVLHPSTAGAGAGPAAGAGEPLAAEGTSDRLGSPAFEATMAQANHRVRGHIVLVASTAAQRGEAFHADYAASKGALLSLTKSLSSELGRQGILCNCVAPGWVRTEMSAGTLGDSEASKKALALIPLGRAADPDEIAGPIVFLCTPWAGFISGEIWNVNGGAVLVG